MAAIDMTHAGVIFDTSATLECSSRFRETAGDLRGYVPARPRFPEARRCGPAISSSSRSSAAAYSLCAPVYFPLFSESRKVNFDPGPTQYDEFRAVVKRVDESFRDDWKRRGVSPAPRAEDLAVAHGLSLALTGSVPSLEEIRQFEPQPPETRLDGWANHLLHDRRFADYFADRLARAYVGTEDGPLIAYRKRRYLAWLSDELHKNTSYAEIVRQMIAAQGLNTDKPAVNFIAATYDDNKKTPDPEKLAIRVSRAFLGLRIDCAQCHDHFLEPAWKQTHFQALAAFFGQTRHAITNIHDDGEGEYRFEDRVQRRHARDRPGGAAPARTAPGQGTRRERLAAWVTDTRTTSTSRGPR